TLFRSREVELSSPHVGHVVVLPERDEAVAPDVLHAETGVRRWRRERMIDHRAEVRAGHSDAVVEASPEGSARESSPARGTGDLVLDVNVAGHLDHVARAIDGDGGQSMVAEPE